MSRSIHVLTVVLCLAPTVTAQQPVVHTGAGVIDTYTAKDPSARFVSADAAGVTLTTSKGMVRLAGPHLTYQDEQGKWQAAKPVIASNAGGGWKQSGTSVDVSLVGGGPNKRLRIGKGTAAWELGLDGASHKKDNEFNFTAGGRPCA